MLRVNSSIVWDLYDRAKHKLDKNKKKGVKTDGIYLAMVHTHLGYCAAARLFEWNVPESKICTTDSSSDPVRGLYVEFQAPTELRKGSEPPGPRNPE
jgi:hypothetical protein